LIVGAICLALNNKGFCFGQKGQKKINVSAIISQVADINVCGARLRGVIPQKKPVARIAARRSSVCLVEKQT
jgi:hypothetical protein